MIFNPDCSKPADEVVFSRKNPPIMFNNVLVKRI